MDSVNSLLKEKLNKLECVLSEIKKSDRCEINIFPAVGVIRQEVKHSAFLAWLLLQVCALVGGFSIRNCPSPPCGVWAILW